MSSRVLNVGFIPLLDAAPVIVAHDMGFAREEGLDLNLRAFPSWSSLRDALCFGHVDAAHMLAPVPVASALGLGGAGVALHALSVLSINGNVIGVSNAIASAMRGGGFGFDFADATAAGEALIRVANHPLRIGVPFPFSMHAELVYYWLSALGYPAPQNIDVRTVPPPLMADAMKAGELDAFCVGEPWGSRSVDAGVAELLLPCSAIWAFAPEKVLAVRASWADERRDLGEALIRAVWRAARWLSDPSSKTLTTELLSHTQYLGLSSEVLERALVGRFVIDGAGTTRDVTGFVDFFSGTAGFPWRSQAEWMGIQLATRTGLDRNSAAEAARRTFRSDLYRAALDGVMANLPSASSKLEGAVDSPTAVASVAGRLILPTDRFFDGRVFEPLPQ